MRLTRFDGSYAVARMGPAASVPDGILDGPGFRTVSRTEDELSVVCPEGALSDADKIDGGWACFKLHGPFAFDEVGIVAGLSRTLADRKIGIFVISTFDTDYILVKQDYADAAAAAWRESGHQVD